MRFYFGRFAQVLSVAVIVLFLLGWNDKAVQAAEQKHASSQTVKKYSLQGKVLSVDLKAGEFTVHHGDIPGFMPAMTMAYKVKDLAVLRSLVPGDQFTAVVLVTSGSDDYLVDEIVLTSHAGGNLTTHTESLHQLKPGDVIPNIALVNQDGRAIHLKDYRGKPLLVTFIYTRCPMPKACPMISSHLARVHALLARDAKTTSNTHLLSITLDPAYDTPSVLRDYGLAYLQGHREGFQHWEFARSAPADLKALAKAFGLEYHEENRQIIHTVRTILIGPDGKLLQSWDGSGWNPQEIAEAVIHAIPGSVR